MKILRVRDSFMYYGGGDPRMFAAGDLIDASDPVVKGREALFQDVEDFVQQKTDRPQIGLRGRVIERASAEPGEKRAFSPKPDTKPDDKSDTKVDDKKDEKADDKPAARSSRTTSATGAKGKQDGEV